MPWNWFITIWTDHRALFKKKKNCELTFFLNDLLSKSYMETWSTKPSHLFKEGNNSYLQGRQLHVSRLRWLEHIYRKEKEITLAEGRRVESLPTLRFGSACTTPAGGDLTTARSEVPGSMIRTTHKVEWFSHCGPENIWPEYILFFFFFLS